MKGYKAILGDTSALLSALSFDNIVTARISPRQTKYAYHRYMFRCMYIQICAYALQQDSSIGNLSFAASYERFHTHECVGCKSLSHKFMINVTEGYQVSHLQILHLLENASIFSIDMRYVNK